MRPSEAPATSRRGPRGVVAGIIASPVGNSPSAWVADVLVVFSGGSLVGSRRGAQPVIRPSGTGPWGEEAPMKVSLNMNLAGTRPSPLCWLILNELEALNTMPVGDEAVTSSGTFSNWSLPLAPLYSVIFVSRSAGSGTQLSPHSEAGLKLLFTHSGVLGPKAMPHGFLTSLSRSRALPGRSETRLTCLKALWCPWCRDFAAAGEPTCVPRTPRTKHEDANAAAASLPRRFSTFRPPRTSCLGALPCGRCSMTLSSSAPDSSLTRRDSFSTLLPASGPVKTREGDLEKWVGAPSGRNQEITGSISRGGQPDSAR